MKNLFNKIFRDKNGNIVIAQNPNAPLILAVIFYLLRFFGLHQLSILATAICLIYWAILEIKDGVNLFGRVLGLTVLFYIFLTFH